MITGYHHLSIGLSIGFLTLGPGFSGILGRDIPLSREGERGRELEKKRREAIRDNSHDSLTVGPRV